jgi:drug/metabolite transporter (DMT)-like permease
MIAALLAICAATSNALSAVLQRRAAASVPSVKSFRLKLIWELIQNRTWLLGGLAIMGGFLFQAGALAAGQLALVQPVLVAELPITLICLAVAFRLRVVIRTWLAVVGVSVGLAVVLALAAPSGGSSTINVLPGAIAIAACVGTMLALIAIGLRQRGSARAALYAGSAGVGFALTAALMKDATGQLGHGGVAAMLGSWQVYLMALAGLASFFIWQNALQAGPLVAGQPVIVLADPLVSMALGVGVFGEKLRLGALLIPEILGVVLIAWSSIELARSPLVAAGKDFTSELDEPQAQAQR